MPAHPTAVPAKAYPASTASSIPPALIGGAFGTGMAQQVFGSSPAADRTIGNLQFGTPETQKRIGTSAEAAIQPQLFEKPPGRLFAGRVPRRGMLMGEKEPAISCGLESAVLSPTCTAVSAFIKRSSL